MQTVLKVSKIEIPITFLYINYIYNSKSFKLFLKYPKQKF